MIWKADDLYSISSEWLRVSRQQIYSQILHYRCENCAALVCKFLVGVVVGSVKNNLEKARQWKVYHSWMKLLN